MSESRCHFFPFDKVLLSYSRPTVKSRLRLEAAVSILHLSSVEKFSETITPHFLDVALMIQDPCYEVREIFQDKLIRLVQGRKLPVRFNIIPFLTAHDPVDELRAKAKSFVLLQLRRSPPGENYFLRKSDWFLISLCRSQIGSLGDAIHPASTCTCPPS